MSMSAVFSPGTWAVHVHGNRSDALRISQEPALVIHELYHGYQLNGTTVGCWLNVIHALKAVLTIEFLGESRRHQRPLPKRIPFLSGDTVTDPLQRQLRIVWKSARVVENVLLGERTDETPPPATFFGSWTNIVNFMAAYSGSSSNAEEARALEHFRAGCDGPLAPLTAKILTPRFGKSYAAGARMVMENAAVVASAGWPKVRSTRSVLQEIVERHSDFYWSLTLPLSAPYADRPWEVFQHTAMAIFDLALMMPFLPGHASLCEECAWTDIHPGHRIKALIHSILDEPPEPITVMPRDYDPLVDRLCERQGWPTPRRIAQLFNQKSMSHVALLDHTAHLDCFAAACQLRRQASWALAHPFLYQLLTDTHNRPFDSSVMPVTALLFDEGADMVLDPLRLKERMELQTWMWLGQQLMEGERLDLDACDYLGDRSDLKQLARDRIVRFVETDPLNDGSGLGPLLRISDYQ